jgi:hypothetical protein
MCVGQLVRAPEFELFIVFPPFRSFAREFQKRLEWLKKCRHHGLAGETKLILWNLVEVLQNYYSIFRKPAPH